MPTVMITGANRGLGLEFARQYAADGWNVLAACRNPDGANELAQLASGNENVWVVKMDVSSAESIRDTAGALKNESIDVLINNAGIFGPKRQADNDPRQTFGYLVPEICAEVYAINAIAPLMIAETFLPSVIASDQKKIVTITSTAGSIAQSDGGIYAYRMSKAAVNMAMANLASDLAEQGVLVGIINPGWVKTDMGGAEAALEPAHSIACMRRVIASLSQQQSGTYLDYDGASLPW